MNDALPPDLAALARELDDLGAAALGAIGEATGGGADALPNLAGSDYRLLRLVGRGGMDAVYEAEQISLGRRVAGPLPRPSSRFSRSQSPGPPCLQRTGRAAVLMRETPRAKSRPLRKPPAI